MFSLGGVAHYLFQPLAEAVIFAMLASYILSRTLVPTLAMYLLKPREETPAPARNSFTRAQKAFDRGFEAFRLRLSTVADDVSEEKRCFCSGVCAGLFCRGRARAVAWAGLFPEHR